MKQEENSLFISYIKRCKVFSYGTGQITTFNQLGFSSVNDKSDGWYLPVQANQVAIILETKATKKLELLQVTRG